MHKTGQSLGFLGRLLLKTAFRLIGNVLKPVAKSILIPLGLTTAAPVTDVNIHKKIFGPGMIILMISNKGMSDVMK